MFRTLINDAKSAAGSVVAKYAVRASVAVPFLVAAGFGIAALTLVLVERFGSLTAYGIMAGGFAALGLVAALAVTVKEQEEEVADAAAEHNDTAEVATDAAAQAAVQLPLALLGTLLTSPLGPGTALGGAKMIGRNLPLVVLASPSGPAVLAHRETASRGSRGTGRPRWTTPARCSALAGAQRYGPPRGLTKLRLLAIRL